MEMKSENRVKDKDNSYSRVQVNLRIAYVIEKFPSPTEYFVLNEIHPAIAYLSDNASKLSRLKIEPEILENPLDIFRLFSCSKSNHSFNLLVVDKQLTLYLNFCLILS